MNKISISPKKVFVLATVILSIFIYGCGEKIQIERVPDGENTIITEDGHFFVSGGKNFYLISKNDDGSYSKNALAPEPGSYGGIAEHNGYLYVMGGNKGLDIYYNPEIYIFIASVENLVAAAREKEVCNKFSAVNISRVMQPNGMACDEDGYLYIAAQFGGQIVRYKISDDDPYSLIGPEKWLVRGVNMPNGIVVKDQILYFTDYFSVKKVAIQEDGEPGEVQTIHTRISVLDDLTAFSDGLVVTDFVQGTIFHLTFEGELVRESSPELFKGPSSVVLGKPPLFEEGELIVTEKGMLFETNSAFGNSLTLFKLFD